jgi:ribonuclease-3
MEAKLTPEEFIQAANLPISDPHVVRRALTHRSYINEHPEVLEDNERLEYLGDAALDFLTAAWLYNRFPEMDEGDLTRLRSALVRTGQLAEFAEQIHLGDALLLGRGEELTGGRTRPALLCDAFESVIGAIYIDSGIEAVAEFMEPMLTAVVEMILEDDTLVDPRSLLQMWAQSELGETPRYRTVEAHGPDHAREFVVEVKVGLLSSAVGRGRSKQEAAQEAAAEALEEIEQRSMSQ